MNVRLEDDSRGTPPSENNKEAPRSALSNQEKKRLMALGGLALLLCAIFIGPLGNFVRFALQKERNSYLLVIPFISAYLIWIKRTEINLRFVTSAGLAAIPLVLGGLALAASFQSGAAEPVDQLSLQISAILCFFIAGCFALVGGPIMRQIAFPLGFLIFAIPMPTHFADAIEIFLQQTSAVAAYLMLSVTPVPFLREGLTFQLPGISIRVAQECSGYNSSFALFMVSTLAGYMFLKSPWRKTALAAAVIPLAILRNGFRITTIALLCVYMDPTMIDSYIHHHGGPIFFALSLIPFLMLLWWLRKVEAAKSRRRINSK